MRKGEETSSWPARETFSLLNTDVSKSRETGALTAEDATILAEREDLVPCPGTVADRDLRDFEVEETKLMLGEAKVVAFDDLRGLEDGRERVGAMDEVAAAICSLQCSKKRLRGGSD